MMAQTAQQSNRRSSVSAGGATCPVFGANGMMMAGCVNSLEGEQQQRNRRSSVSVSGHNSGSNVISSTAGQQQQPNIRRASVNAVGQPISHRSSLSAVHDSGSNAIRAVPIPGRAQEQG